MYRDISSFSFGIFYLLMPFGSLPTNKNVRYTFFCLLNFISKCKKLLNFKSSKYSGLKELNRV